MLEGLDDNTLDEIARIACGGEDVPVYRRGNELAQLLQQSGWTNVTPYTGEPRRQWLTAQLQARRNHPGAIDQLVRRLADKREYIHRNEPLAAAETARLLNVVLAVEGFEIAHSLGRPVIRPYSEADEEPQEAPDVALHVTMADLIRDPDLATVLGNRLAEARKCDRSGAYTAAIIMLGSLLEGVLLDAMISRVPNPPKAPDQWYLSKLIDYAHQSQWIQEDVHRFAETLREYRNLVHPNLQVKIRDFPDEDTVRMCWPVIHAVLNDLASTA